MATIRIGARLFKVAKTTLCQAAQKTLESLQHTKVQIMEKSRVLIQKLRQLLEDFFAKYRASGKGKRARLVLVHSQAEATKAEKQTVSMKIKSECRADKQGLIREFYAEWESCHGPALTSMDRQFLESASLEVVEKVVANGRLTLKSPYLKAVYNGLKDLVDISDLMVNDELAKDHIRPTLESYYERGPEVFYEMLDFLHDKGNFPTRSGLRRLSLDPRLIPEWLGLNLSYGEPVAS